MKHQYEEQISINTLNTIHKGNDKRTVINNSRIRAEKTKGLTEYAGAKRQVRKSIRDDKRKYMKDLATTVEKAGRKENMGQLYDNQKTSRKIR